VRWLFDPGGTIAARYVNLEKPAVSWNDGDPAGVDAISGASTSSGRSDRAWDWKDDDELPERIHLPHLRGAAII
jgi:hypothetical protein